MDATLHRTTRILLLLALGTTPALAQTSASGTKPEKFSGCVLPSPGDTSTLILNTPTVCAKLTGKLDPEKLRGHEIDLTGILMPGSRTVPALVQVQSVSHVGKACSEVCSLLPPGGRGLGGERPGKEGGTPGETSRPTPPAPNR